MKAGPFKLCVLILLSMGPWPAAAHIVFSNATMPSGARYQVTNLRVGHGCNGSATTSLRVEIPVGVTAKPQAKWGWTITVETQPLPAPVVVEGKTVTERVSAITWAGRLADDQFDEFGLMVSLPPQAGPLYFPAHQVCESGRRDWTDIPAAGQAWHDVPSPAPVLNLSAADDPHAGHKGH